MPKKILDSKEESKKEEVKKAPTAGKKEDKKKAVKRSNVITFPTNIANYLSTVTDKKLNEKYSDYYIDALLRKTFTGQVKTKEKWKEAIDNLLNKNL